MLKALAHRRGDRGRGVGARVVHKHHPVAARGVVLFAQPRQHVGQVGGLVAAGRDDCNRRPRLAVSDVRRTLGCIGIQPVVQRPAPPAGVVDVDPHRRGQQRKHEYRDSDQTQHAPTLPHERSRPRADNLWPPPPRGPARSLRPGHRARSASPPFSSALTHPRNFSPLPIDHAARPWSPGSRGHHPEGRAFSLPHLRRNNGDTCRTGARASHRGETSLENRKQTNGDPGSPECATRRGDMNKKQTQGITKTLKQTSRDPFRDKVIRPVSNASSAEKTTENASNLE